MSKNEYRRAFIMLRPAVSGLSGHVRLERRTMTGSLYFIVSAPGEGYAAALAGQRGGEYYAAPLGELKRDVRGQLTLACAFDPRAIDGRPLEAYQLLVVAQVGAEGCRIALTGNVDGAYPMDSALVREAVCALYRADIPADDLPAPSEEVPPQAEPMSPQDVAAPAPEPEPEQPPAEDAIPANADAVLSEALTEPLPESVREPIPEPVAEPAPEPVRTRIYTRMRSPAVSAAEIPATAPESTPEPVPTPVPEPVATDAAWCVQADRRATPCTMPLEDGYTYIRMPLPAACQVDYCMLGVRIRSGRVQSVRCALPGSYSPTPPQGLAGSVWLGAGDGTGAGYWVFTVPCEAGTSAG